MIKAIETTYKGYRFRSRLEARWAVFFDALGLQWEYEVEGYELPSGWYLPDFLFRVDIDGQQKLEFIEIKGTAPTARDLAVAADLARAASCLVHIHQGDPGQCTGWRFFPEVTPVGPEPVDVHFLEFKAWCLSGFTRHHTGSEMMTAAHAARSARFEHGESGAAVGASAHARASGYDLLLSLLPTVPAPIVGVRKAFHQVCRDAGVGSNATHVKFHRALDMLRQEGICGVTDGHIVKLSTARGAWPK